MSATQNQTSAFLSYGFRPFFILGSLQAFLLPLQITLDLLGYPLFETSYGSFAYHGHEMVYGFVIAIISGFLLTAIPNWTGRPPLNGAKLGVLALIWIAGRLAFAFSNHIPENIVAVIDIAYSVIFAAIVWREILAAKNMRNAPVGVMITFFAIGNICWHYFYLTDGEPALSLYLGIVLVTLLISLIAGRIIPAFTNNWSKKAGMPLNLPVFDLFDKIAVLSLLVSLFVWLIHPEEALSAGLLLGVAILHFIRLFRWKGWKTTKEPLVTVLHLAYFWLPVGLLAIAYAGLDPERFSFDTALHAMTSGTIGVMIIAVMTRVCLGHTGRALHADKMTLVIYLLINLGAGLRIYAPFMDTGYGHAISMSATFWSGAFLLFLLKYGRYLLK